MAKRKHPRPVTVGEMMSFRLESESRIALYKLANKRHLPVSAVMRDLIRTATAQKSAAGVAAQSPINNQAA